MDYKVFFTDQDGHTLPALLWTCADDIEVFTRARMVLEIFGGQFSEVSVMGVPLNSVIFRMWR